MAVFYNSETGQYDIESQSLNPIEESAFLANEARLHTGTGWHEYSSVQAMNAAVAANRWPAPHQNNNPVTSTVQQAAGTAAQAAQIPGLSQVGDFFSRLTQPSTWIRVAEVVIGAGLIIVALAKLASDTPVGRTAAKAGKAAMIL